MNKRSWGVAGINDVFIEKGRKIEKREKKESENEEREKDHEKEKENKMEKEDLLNTNLFGDRYTDESMIIKRSEEEIHLLPSTRGEEIDAILNLMKMLTYLHSQDK